MSWPLLPAQLITALQALTPDLPPEAWWLAAVLLLLLGLAAAIDAFKGMVPDALIFPGLLGLVVAQGLYLDLPYAAHQLEWGLGFAFVLWLVNEGCYRLSGQDAFGMGDVKWSILAVAGFGLLPVAMAWGAGACLGSLWLGGLKLLRRPVKHVHFAPFLFIGLLGSLYWLHLR